MKGQRGVLFPVEVVQGGKTFNCFWASAKIGIRAAVLAAAHRIARGSTIREDDITAKETEIPDLNAQYLRNPDDVLGNMARRNLSPGDPLTRDAITKPYLVTRGETVQLRLERNGIVLTSAARAEQDGKIGQVIRVRSLDFATSLKAQVTGKAEVELYYQERLNR